MSGSAPSDGYPLTEHHQRLDDIARRFHEGYEALSPLFGCEASPETAAPWEQVPDNNRALMRVVIDGLLTEGTIR